VVGPCKHGNVPSGYHQMLGISSESEYLLGSQEGICLA
jgi:hypothetical protein